MPEKNVLASLLPTIFTGVGMLCGGLFGALAGALMPNEQWTIACYAIGAVGGAIAGGVIGMKLFLKTSAGNESLVAADHSESPASEGN